MSDEWEKTIGLADISPADSDGDAMALLVILTGGANVFSSLTRPTGCGRCGGRVVKRLDCFDRRERRWRKERVEHGISEGDAWDLSAYLDGVIAKGARQLAGNLHGCPAGMADEFGGDLDKACAHWQSILEEIANGFEKELEAQADFKPSPPDFYRAMDLLREHWRDLWD